MKKLIAVVIATVFVISTAYAAPTGKPIGGSKHDFSTGYVGAEGTYTAVNKCNTCHAPHKAKRNSPLWRLNNPDANVTWTMWNGSNTGQALTSGLNNGYISVQDFTASSSGLCMGCHDGATAMNDTSGVKMRAAYNGNWGRDLKASHPVAKVVVFGIDGWQANLPQGNSASLSNVELETGGSVGCTSCHSMHSSDSARPMLQRKGEMCMSCHDK